MTAEAAAASLAMLSIYIIKNLYVSKQQSRRYLALSTTHPQTRQTRH